MFLCSANDTQDGKTALNIRVKIHFFGCDLTLIFSKAVKHKDYSSDSLLTSERRTVDAPQSAKTDVMCPPAGAARGKEETNVNVYAIKPVMGR